MLIYGFFKVLTSALVSRIKFGKDSGDENRVATGVEFLHGGATHTALINKEVVLSAG